MRRNPDCKVDVIKLPNSCNQLDIEPSGIHGVEHVEELVERHYLVVDRASDVLLTRSNAIFSAL